MCPVVPATLCITVTGRSLQVGRTVQRSALLTRPQIALHFPHTKAQRTQRFPFLRTTRMPSSNSCHRACEALGGASVCLPADERRSSREAFRRSGLCGTGILPVWRRETPPGRATLVPRRSAREPETILPRCARSHSPEGALWAGGASKHLSLGALTQKKRQTDRRFRSS